jgi:outer membrane lipoprotein SlyB
LAAALGGVGGALVGGLVGSATERAAGDADGWEYIVRRRDGNLVSVTQVDATPLAVGTRVLVIAGAQARIVPDYTSEPEPPAPVPAPPPAAPAPPPAATAPEGSPAAPPDPRRLLLPGSAPI